MQVLVYQLGEEVPFYPWVGAPYHLEMALDHALDHQVEEGPLAQSPFLGVEVRTHEAVQTHGRPSVAQSPGHQVRGLDGQNHPDEGESLLVGMDASEEGVVH